MEKLLENEWDRLCNGKLGDVKGTNTIAFVHKRDVPIERKITYGNFRLDHRPLKLEPMRVRLTVGGDKLDSPFDATAPASGLLEFKLIINSTISQQKKNTRFVSSDLKDFSSKRQ